MSSAVRLPTEIRQFLSLPGPQSLLLRGPPGSGKTTLTLAMLEAFPGARFLVTSRVSGQELAREFPWLGHNGGRDIHVLDTSGSLDAISTTAQAEPHVKNLLKGDDRSLRDLRAFMWLPPPIQEVWSHLDENKPTMVVVDSWDALVEAYLGDASSVEGVLPDRPQVERMLLRRMAASPVHLVLVLEREEQSQLDYLTNGVIQTQIDLHEERLERWLRVRKVRGVRIENTLYPFTLDGGRFDAIEPLGPYRTVRLTHHEPEPDPMPDHLWPGSRAYAESFGRMPVGQLSLLELDPNVPRYVPDILLTPLVSQMVEKGGPVMIVPDARPDPKELYTAMKGRVQRAKFLQLVRYMAAPPSPGSVTPPLDDFSRTIMTIKMPDPTAPPEENEAVKFLRTGGTPGVPSLSIIHISGLYAMANAFKIPITPEVISSFAQEFQPGFAGRPMHGIVVGRTGAALFEALRPLAGTHLRVRSRQGRALIHGVLPWTPQYLLVEGQDPAPYGLLRVI